MKKFTINCDFGGQMSPFSVYVGKPEHNHHPLHFQSDWLAKNRGGTIPSEVMDAITQLKELADKNNVSLEDLCIYALGTTKEQEELDAQESSVDTATTITDTHDANNDTTHADEEETKNMVSEKESDSTKTDSKS